MTFTYDPTNIFARILRGEIPSKTIYDSEHALAFEDIVPQAPVHVLVIPKGAYVSLDHFAMQASAEEQAGFFAAIAEICELLDLKDGFRAVSNTRGHGCQTVPHFHLHILGGAQFDPALLP